MTSHPQFPLQQVHLLIEHPRKLLVQIAQRIQHHFDGSGRINAHLLKERTKKVPGLSSRSAISLHALQFASQQIGLLTFHPFFLLLFSTDVEQRKKERMVYPALKNNPYHCSRIKYIILLAILPAGGISHILPACSICLQFPASRMKHRSRHHHDKHSLILTVGLIQDIIHLVGNALHDVGQLQDILYKGFGRQIQLCRGKLRYPLVMIQPERIYEDNEYIIRKQASSSLPYPIFIQMYNHISSISSIIGFSLRMHPQRCFSSHSASLRFLFQPFQYQCVLPSLHLFSYP